MIYINSSVLFHKYLIIRDPTICILKNKQLTICLLRYRRFEFLEYYRIVAISMFDLMY